MKSAGIPQLLENKVYTEASVFLPENLLREAKRQKGIPNCHVPGICVLDPDGDLADYLLKTGRASLNECWACYHSKMYSFKIDEVEIGIIPCIVGASYAVLVAEQLFVSGCKSLISVTSAGIINHKSLSKRFALLTESVRDEGTSYHYLPQDTAARLPQILYKKLAVNPEDSSCPYFEAKSWTTDAPYRETQTAIAAMERTNCLLCRNGGLCTLCFCRGQTTKCYLLCASHQYNGANRR